MPFLYNIFAVINMKTEEKEKEMVGFRLELAHKEELDSFCTSRRLDKSEVLRMLVKIFLRDRELQKRIMGGVFV